MKLREKVHFLNTPTPLEKLETLSKELGINLYIKRDDLTNYGTGGNKLRKLEYFLKDAQDQGATMLLTVGGPQTNHGRLTAAVAARAGMKSAIVAVGDDPGEISANLLLDGIMGCHVYIVKPQEGVKSSQLQADKVAAVTEEWTAKGEKVYYIPMGGSNELGALGYYDCGLELAEQIQEQSLEDPLLITTVGSMGTYAGLFAAQIAEDLPYRLTGISIMPRKDAVAEALDYFEKVKSAFSLPGDAGVRDVHIETRFDYGGYNNAVPEVRQAIYRMGRTEAIILDPCYTGKTFNAILKLVESGKIGQGETVIFLHTGGVPGIYTGHHRIEMERELAPYIHIG